MNILQIDDTQFQRLIETIPEFTELDAQVMAGGTGAAPYTNIEAPRDKWSDDAYRFWQHVENPSKVFSREEPGRGIAILDDMRLTDSEIGTALIDRSRALGAMDWSVESLEKDNSFGIKQAELFTIDLIEGDVENLIQALSNLTYYGYMVGEIYWTWKQTRWGFERVCPIPQWAWKFDRETHAPRLYSKLGWGGSGNYSGVPVTPGRFLVAINPDPTDGTNPYGLAEGTVVYYPARWKNWALRTWMNTAAKIGGLNGVGKYPSTATPSQITSLRNGLDRIQNSQNTLLPEGFEISFPEWGRYSIKSFFESMIGYFDASIRKALLGASLGTSESQGTGTYAQAKVHSEVSDLWLEGSAKKVETAINKLARLWTDFNYGKDVPAPKFGMDYERREDQVMLVGNVKTLLDAGILLNSEELYNRIGWKQPEGIADTITGRTPSPVNPIPSFSEHCGHDHGAARPAASRPTHKRAARVVNFSEGEKESARREKDKDVLMGKIISYFVDAPEGYAAFLTDLEGDISKAKSFDEAKKMGVPGALIIDFGQSIKDAMASMVALMVDHETGKLGKIAKFAEAAQLEKIAQFAEAGDVGEFTLDFVPSTEAYAYMRNRAPMLSQRYYKQLDEQLHNWSFTVSNIESQKTVAAIQQSITDALQSGQTFEQWQRGMLDTLSAGDIAALRPGQLETVFRTNMASAYSAGHEAYVNDVDPRHEFYDRYTFYTSQLENVCPICAPRHGLTFERTDGENVPPLHYNCACDIAYESPIVGAPDIINDADRGRLLPPGEGFDTSPAQTLKVGLQ